MLDVRLQYLGSGQFQTAWKGDFDACQSELDEGDVVKANITRPRSVRQNAYFHALVQHAYENQRGGPTFESWEHMRAWIVIMSGWCDEVRIDLQDMQSTATATGAVMMARKMAGALKSRVSFMTVSYDEKRQQVVLRFAKSISFRSCPSEKMQGIVDTALHLICTEIVPGVDPESIMNMAKERAA